MIKIKFTFADGTIKEVEVEDEYGKAFLEEERKMENEERRIRYWCRRSLDRGYEDENFIDPNPTPIEQVMIDEEQKRVDEFKATLTDVQRRRLEMLYDGLTISEISRIENVDHKAVTKSINQVREKYKKFFNK